MEQKNHGGKREGAGRPQSEHKQRPLSVKLDWDVAEKLACFKGNRNRFINEAIRAKLKKELQ